MNFFCPRRKPSSSQRQILNEATLLQMPAVDKWIYDEISGTRKTGVSDMFSFDQKTNDSWWITERLYKRYQEHVDFFAADFQRRGDKPTSKEGFSKKVTKYLGETKKKTIHDKTENARHSGYRAKSQ